MIGVNMEFWNAVEDRSVLLKSCNNGEQFLLHCGIVSLRCIELLGEVSDRLILLHDHRAHLGVASVRVYMERFRVIGIADK